MQVLLGAMLIDALHAAIEDRIVALNRVRGDGLGYDDGLAIGARLVGHFVPIAGIFFLAMVPRVMAGIASAGFLVLRGFIGHEAAFLGDVRLEDWRELLSST